MKQKYSERPQETWLEVLHDAPGGACIVHLNENITELPAEQEEGQIQYEANHYAIDAIFRPGLEQSITQNRNVWLMAAKAKDMEGQKLTLEARVKNLETMQDDLTLAILGI